MKTSKRKYKRPHSVPNNIKAYPKMKIKNKSDEFPIVSGKNMQDKLI